MTKIQQKRIDSYINSLNLRQDLNGILENHATDKEIDYIKDKISSIL